MNLFSRMTVLMDENCVGLHHSYCVYIVLADTIVELDFSFMTMTN